ncbi:unnamed protein product [Spirodela intermedia]|uniref:Uncharacterized protein n=1 Tax=Spirodela intermedia TaxID=51605 RepID=A0A7I8J0S1_SPIIN|nr:unnamed protein product [Spirodela intermedia]CAA6662910.1 unnamed protein product [Spirodela intermedia]
MEEIDEVFRLLDSPKGRELCELLSSLLSTDGLPPPPEPFLKGDNDAGGRNGGPAVPVTVTWMPFFGAHCSRCHILRDVIHAGVLHSCLPYYIRLTCLHNPQQVHLSMANLMILSCSFFFLFLV